MIQANEVRRGNWILFDDRYFKIDVISEEFPTLDTMEFGLGVVDWNNIRPIQLTEEILLKCGFDEKYSIVIKAGRKKIKFQCGSRVVSTGHRSGWYCKQYRHIKYLHQLQNLYWCLCGKELEVNL